MSQYLYGTALVLLLPLGKNVSRLTILLRGASGSGKSDLAFRCLMQQKAELISDDQVQIISSNPLLLQAPSALNGLIEVRGVGIMRFPVANHPPPLSLVIDLVPANQVERLPEITYITMADQTLPCLPLHPFEASAPDKLIAAGLGCYLHTETDLKSHFFTLTAFD